MKSPAQLDPLAAFPNEKHEPDDAALESALGRAFSPVGRIIADLVTACPQATAAWQYSKQAGWYRVSLLKKRRLFYLIPKRGGFQLSLILGGKAIAALTAGSHAAAVNALLANAKRYSEGTAFSFNHRNCKPGLIAALVAAKLAH